MKITSTVSLCVKTVCFPAWFYNISISTDIILYDILLVFSELKHYTQDMVPKGIESFAKLWNWERVIGLF